jgi:hypothetical protein
VSKPNDGVFRVEKALKAAVGDRMAEVMHRRTKHLANLTPHQVAQTPSGARIVLAELDNIVLQARRSDV